MRVLKSILIMLSVALAATAVSAAPGGKFAAADSNKDRALTKAEACAGKTPRICKNFEAIDANKDGSVTRAEIRAFRHGKRLTKGAPPKP